jgi:hypothetical protein
MKSRFSAKAHKLLMPPARPGGQMTAQVLAVKAACREGGFCLFGFDTAGLRRYWAGQEDYQ